LRRRTSACKRTGRVASVVCALESRLGWTFDGRSFTLNRVEACAARLYITSLVAQLHTLTTHIFNSHLQQHRARIYRARDRLLAALQQLEANGTSARRALRRYVVRSNRWLRESCMVKRERHELRRSCHTSVWSSRCCRRILQPPEARSLTCADPEDRQHLAKVTEMHFMRLIRYIFA
jgi:hypothetical protein